MSKSRESIVPYPLDSYGPVFSKGFVIRHPFLFCCVILTVPPIIVIQLDLFFGNQTQFQSIGTNLHNCCSQTTSIKRGRYVHLRRQVVLKMSTVCRFSLIAVKEYPRDRQVVNNVRNFVNVVCERPLKQFSYHRSSQELAISAVHVRTYRVNFIFFMEFWGSKKLFFHLGIY